jgi:dihydrofolate synthase/folylpolyglutamate synthase
MDYSGFMEYLGQAETMRTPPRLTDMQTLLTALGNPQDRFASVHIAGTNGKGSTAAFIESALRCADYKAGLYTSPHVSRLNERIRVCGADIPDAALCALAERVQAAERAEGLKLNYFQILTAIGFLYFAQEGCQVAVVEAGLGGRLDPTNVLLPLVAVITRIGMDHTSVLGDTLGKIASEKAGIVKPGCDVVLLSQEAEAEQPVEEACARLCARLHKTPALPTRLYGGKLYEQTDMGEIAIGLSGSYQAENAALALTTLGTLKGHGFDIPDDALRTGLQGARWPGRFELLRENPPLLLDGAHNPQGAQSLAQSLAAYYPGKKCVFLMAAMRDKDVIGCIRAVAPLARAMVAIPLDSPRAYTAQELQSLMLQYCSEAFASDGVDSALRLSQTLLQEGDVTCAFGSLYLADPLRRAIGK